MNKLLALAALTALTALAQPTVAPTAETVGIPRGDTLDGYNIRQSFELGYRFHIIGGDEGMYRSTVNYGNGIRLLSSSLSMISVDGHGKYFDTLQLNTQGLGNDPYQSASLRIDKNKWYKYDFTWRSNAYYNPGLSIIQNVGYADTVRHYQDQDLTLLPQSPIKFFLGYSRDTQTGPAITSQQLLDTRGDQFPLFANMRRRQNEVRAGFEVALKGWRLNAMHGWVNFNEDTATSLTTPSAGINPNDLSTLTSLQRTEPYSGSSPYWRVVLFKDARTWAFNSRFTYVDGQRGFVQDQTALGTDRFGNPGSQQVVTQGNASRPALSANTNFSVFPARWVTLTNQTAFSQIKMSGSSVFTELVNGLPVIPSVPFQYLGLRTITNASDADLHPTRWFGLRLGYQYSTRRISSIEGINLTGPQTPYQQENGLHSGVLGIRLRPVKNLTVNLDGEMGRADRPIYPVSGRNYQAFRGRIEYRMKTVRLAGYTRTDYNLNSQLLSNFASHSRQYGADATWTKSSTFYVDLSYVKLHLDTLGTLNYFASLGGPIVNVPGDQSYYVSNLHTAMANAHFVVRRADLSLGVSHIQDVGDGRATAVGSGVYASIPAFQAVQTFPVRFTSPQARVSIRINEKIRWNAGYQNYGYTQEFAPAKNFRAHTGYTSVLWAF